MKACIFIIEDCDINDLKELINTLENKKAEQEEIKETKYEEIKTINQEEPKHKKGKSYNGRKTNYVIEDFPF